MARQWASWQDLEGCGAAGSDLLHRPRMWRAWAGRLSGACSLTIWMELRRRRRETTRGVKSSSESSRESQESRASDSDSGGGRGGEREERESRGMMCERETLEEKDGEEGED